MDTIERNSPELTRLRNKLDRMEPWLRAQESLPPTERDSRYTERMDAWMSTERKYRRVYDREARGAEQESQAEMNW